MSITDQIQELVKSIAKEHGFDLTTADGYNAAYQAAKVRDPKLFNLTDDKNGQPTKAWAGARAFSGGKSEILQAVKEQAAANNINTATNDGYHRAYALARFHRPELFATNDELKGVTTSKDGTQLNPIGWPAPQERLMKLGLPMNTTEGAYRLFSLADETKITPEMAAVAVRTLIQFSQIERSLNFNEAMAHVEKHRPELYKAAIEAARNRPTKP